MRTRSFRLLALLVFGACLVLACDLGASTGGASAKPTILIQSPVNGSQFQEGSEITVQSVATDASGIAMVDLIVDGAVVRTDKPSAGQSGPLFAFKQKWQATAGAHTIDVRAYNAAGTPSDPMIIAIIVLSSAAQAPSPFPGLATTVLSPAVVPSSPTPTSTVSSPPTPTSTVPSPPTPTSTVTAMATVSPTATVAAASPVVLPPCPPGSATPSGMLFCDDFASQAISKSKGWSFYTAPEDDFTWSPSIAHPDCKATGLLD